MMLADPKQLAAAAVQGDAPALAALVDLLYPRVYAFLRRLAGTDADAADLTQVSFAEFFKALPSYSGRSSLSSWLHSIAYHRYVDWRRANHRANPQPDEFWADLPGASPCPAELAARGDAARALFQAVDRLPQDLRDSVHLHYYQDLTLADTADAMGVAVSTVKYRLRQALDDLERALRERPQPALPQTQPRRI